MTGRRARHPQPARLFRPYPVEPQRCVLRSGDRLQIVRHRTLEEVRIEAAGLGFRQIGGLLRDDIEQLIFARRDQKFTTLESCAQRAKLSKKSLKILADADAFRQWMMREPVS